MSDLAKRLTTFLTIIGIFLLLAFIASDATGKTNFILMVIGLPITAWGIRTLLKKSSAPQKAERFRGVRKLFNRKKGDGDDASSSE